MQNHVHQYVMAPRSFATELANAPGWFCARTFAMVRSGLEVQNADARECIVMKIDPMTLMWIQVATGALGMLTLVYLWRALLRKLGFVLDIKAHFSPKGGCQDAILAELKKGGREILGRAYSSTAEPLALAMVEAKKQGVT